ncbi:gamma-glutamyl-gamma-aminobutyrate hydrolase family protein [Granulicella sibirica]|uniref:Glutamine amidotransferase, class I n=1 Tax=Granulicella sibirica TaxID=2479048 RepID=A0A4V1L692_9BACT|nr:gamma-glutamyl-gamma-aminobutyrate hydrolase family protein [Granulicella sibirica]RXH58454.1 Glutamine amidotransferase, class I [Granulicella sibirica]
MTTVPTSHPLRIAIPVPTFDDLEYNRRSWIVYAEAIRQSGGEPVEVPLTLAHGDLAALASTCQGVLLPGSGADVDPDRYGQDRIQECAPADPARERVDTFLLEDAHQLRKPVFGICFGTQMLNVWRGGALVQDLSILPVNHRAGRSVAIAHTAAIAPESLLGTILQEEGTAASEAPEQDGFMRLPINSSHHQSVAVPGEGLRVSARCPQDAVIEAVEGDAPGHYILGVQWHPERSYEQSPSSRALFARFMKEVAAWPRASN